MPHPQILDLKMCGRCKRAYYCSPECQKQDWNNHKATCPKGPLTEAQIAVQTRISLALQPGALPADELDLRGTLSRIQNCLAKLANYQEPTRGFLEALMVGATRIVEAFINPLMFSDDWNWKASPEKQRQIVRMFLADSSLILAAFHSLDGLVITPVNAQTHPQVIAAKKRVQENLPVAQQISPGLSRNKLKEFLMASPNKNPTLKIDGKPIEGGDYYEFKVHNTQPKVISPFCMTGFTPRRTF